MAKAKKVVPERTYEVQLTLTQEEAETLRTICQRIGGSPEFTRRKHADSIKEALIDIGVDYVETDICPKSRAIYFI